jgi:transposase
VLMEISVTEQRYQAVLAVLGGVPVTEVASRFGVGRQSVHRWLARYEQAGLEGLADRSHRPDSCPHQMDAVTEAQVLEWRRRHPGWGPRRLVHEAGRAGLDPLPSRSGIYRALVRSGLIEAVPRRRRDEKWRRWERGSPMELWQTSDRSMTSSGGRELAGEGLGVVVGLAGRQAVVELTEVAVEQVAQGGGVAVADGAALVVVTSC